MRTAARLAFPLVLALPCLADPGVASGVVTDEKTGKPVVGAAVEALRHVEGPFGAPETRTATADDMGRFRVVELPAGRYSFRITSGDRRRIVRGLDLTEGGSISFDVVLSDRDAPPAWWYALPRTVHDPKEIDLAENGTLSFSGLPFWWPSLRQERYLPRRLEDLPDENWGATLRLTVEPSKADPTLLCISLVMKTGDRPIHRAVQHRGTQVIPFLFAFRADGQVVRRVARSDPLGQTTFWGARGTLELVPARSERRWDLWARISSFERLLEQPGPALFPEKVQIVAAFLGSEQPEGARPDELGVRESEEVSKEALPLRSQVVTLVRKDGAWRVPD